jgi:predicted Zn-dependent protease
MKNLLLIFCLASTIVLFNKCARNPVTGKKEVVLMSEQQELAMGQEADPQIVAQYGLYEDSALQRYMRQQGQQMAAISHRSNINYQFRILNSDVINAFAIPGYVYFTRGIMAHFNNEAQFQGVLGHEIGHIAARHTVQQQRNQMLGQIGLLAGMVFVPQIAQFGDLASQGLGLLMLKNSRDDEREADQLGVEYSTKTGYDAHQMASFFTTLQRQQQSTSNDPLPPFLSTHPDPGERNVTVDRLATEWQQKTGVTNPKVVRDEYLRRIDGLIYGEDPREGYLENGIFYHPVLRFQFPIPTSWKYQNTPQQVQAAPADGKALFIFTLAPGNSLQEAASAAMQKYQLTVVDSRNINVNGNAALAVVADQPAQQQGAASLRTLSYFIQYNNTIYHMIGVSTTTDYNNYVNTFTSMMEGFRSLTDQSKINRQPERIRIKSVSSAGTLEQVLRSYNITSSARLQELAIVNGMNLSDRVAAGTLIKIVQ